MNTPFFRRKYAIFLLAATLAAGCSKDETKSHLFLYGYFSSDKTSAVIGDTVHYQDMSIGYPTTWSWTFEGGTPATSTDQNPSVVYDAPGNYAVTLVVTNARENYTKKVTGYISVVAGIQADTSLVAYYPFDGSAEDAGPAKIPATVTGNVTFDATDRHGTANSAAHFDGTGGILIKDNPTFNFGTDDFTISCWISTDQTQKMMLWQESGALGSKDNQTWLRLGDNTTDRQMRFDTEDGGGGNIINYGGAANLVTDGKWHQVVCVREGGTTRLYVDGVKVSEMQKTGSKNVSNAEDFKIGMQEGPAIGSFAAYYTGLMDDFSVYNKALTDIEIAALYQK